MPFHIIIASVLLVGIFKNVGYAGEVDASMQFNQFEESIFVHEMHVHPSSSLVECQQEQKHRCQSKFLAQELVEKEVIYFPSTSPYSLMQTSLVHMRRKSLDKEFLNIEIYVDRVHRNFEAEILEIFDQSLALEAELDGMPIVLECHCDDREPLAYSYTLGHRWGKLIQTSLRDIAGHEPGVALVNYGNEYGICENGLGECQEGNQLRGTFKFLAIREPRSGCLIRFRLPAQRNLRQEVYKEHPLFLQEIHVAGARPKLVP